MSDRASGIAVADDAAAVDDEHPVGLLRGSEIVRHEQNLGVESREQLVDDAPPAQVEEGRGLVAHEDLWLGREHPGERGQRTGHDFFRFVFGKTVHYTEAGWHKFTRNAALFFLATAVANEAVRLGFDGFEMLALNRLFTGIDIWVLFKIFIVMPATGLYFWWQVQRMQKYRLPDHGRYTDTAHGTDATG